MRKIALALALTLLAAEPAFAVCTVIPALPDTERRTEYTGVSASTGPFNVGFQLYGDSTDYANWLEVWVNGVKKTAVTDYTVATASGPAIGAACLPITNAQVTFLAAQTGTIEIVGARRPRRASQVSENAGVTAHDFNQIISDLTAAQRERWDLSTRTLLGPPGETITGLPKASTRASSILGFDSTGLVPTMLSPSTGLGTVIGPATSVVGHIVTWNSTNGTVVADGGGVAITNPFAGNLTLNPTTGDGLAINPAAASYAKGFNITQTTPITGTTTGPFSANLITLNYQGEIAFTGRTGGLNNTNSAGLRVNVTTGGTNPGSSGVLGSQAINAGVFHLMDTVAGTQAGFPDRIALLSMCYVSVNHGDGHGCYGGNFNVQVDSGGVLAHMIGVEPDMIISGTGTATYRSAFSAVNAGASRAGTVDSAIRVGSAIAGGEWGNVITLIGTTTTGFLNPPVATTAKLVTGSSDAFTMSDLIDLPNVTVTGNIISSPFVTLTGPGAFTLNPSGVASVPTLVASVTQQRIVRNGPVAAQLSAAGSAGAGGAFLALSSARTSVSAPTASQTDDLFGGLAFYGYGATGYSAASRARIFASAAENWSDTLQGTYLSFYTTATGGTTTAEKMRLLGSGALAIGTTIDPAGVGIIIPHSATAGIFGTDSTNAAFMALNPGGSGGHYTILAAPGGATFFQARDADNGNSDAKWGYLNNDTLLITNRANACNTSFAGAGCYAAVDSTGIRVFLGNITMGTATKTLVLKQGANGTVGTFICTSGGSITVTNSNVAISDAIIISLNTVGGTVSTAPAVSAITAATSFVAKCATSDTSTYNYAIIKNAA